MRRYSALLLAAAALTTSAPAKADIFVFNTDPFLGSTALTTPGRQVVGGEPSILFNPASDVFAFDLTVFGVTQLQFFNGLAPTIPSSGVNVVVLQSFDNDGNPATPFAAGNAADLIAAQITVPTPGFFIYFNQGLDLPRLVYSTDLNDNTSDLKILARMTNLSGQPGRDAIPTFTAANFAAVPAPPAFLLVMSAGGLWTGAHLLRRKVRV